MHLKSLTIKGFKSFAEPTTLQFEPGVTCVVGPNGSGKSNVVDALAWVMGEQGAKSLRGGSMEDVIFAGTQSRGPLGRAEVSLTIDNSDGVLPIDYSEVTISRTLFRNGSSEYAINRESARLLDVQELLSDTGLGREMHVIVGQGQLDRVLYASADDRRRFIEEAAGITKHRRRKEKTVRKLEAMDGNLTRLQDLVNEIRRQLKPLGRQADVAREAQSIQSAVRDAKSRLLADDVATLQRELADYQASEGASASERALVQTELDRVVEESASLEAQRASTGVAEARGVDSSLRQVAERIDSLHALAAERVSLLAEQSEASDIGPGVSDDERDEAEGLVDTARQALAAAEVELGDKAALTASARAALEAFDTQLQQSRAARDTWLRKNQERQEALAVAHSRLENATADVAVAKEAVVLADERIAELERQWHDAQVDGDDSGEASTDSAEGALQDAWRREAEAEEHVDTLRHELHRLEREKDALAATVHTLSLALESDQAGTGEQLEGVRGRVADLISINPGFEKAIARALGVLADALVVSTRQAALDLTRGVSGRDDARLSLVVDEVHATSERVELEGLVSAADVANGPEGLMRVLHRVFIAEDLDEINTHWVGHPELPADVVIVTKAGDLFSGTRVQAGSGAQQSAVELTAERDQATTELQRVSTEVERAASRLEQAQHDATQASAEAKRALAEVREFEASRAARSEALSSLAATLDSARGERERAQARVDQAEAAKSLAAEALDNAGQHSEAEPEPIVAVDESGRAALAEALELARAGEVDARVAVEAARSHVGYQESQVVALQQRHQAWLDQREKEAHRAAARRELHRRSTSVAAITPALVRVARASVEESSRRVAELEAARASSDEKAAALRQREAQLRERLTALTDSVHSVEMHIYERNLQLGQLTQKATDELGLSLDVLISEYGPDQPVPLQEGEEEDAAPTDSAEDSRAEDGGAEDAGAEDGVAWTPATKPFDRAEQQKRLARAQKQLDALGRVNPLALEEFDAMEKRHQYLVEQLEDVNASKRDLLSIVDDIDDTMRDVFMAAFADTKAAFDEVFPVLFPGGQGALSLTDPDAPLTTGVEVSVRPRGKNIERLSLLSGGERSLAAVALLIAIFIARPSPFYILDEIEAALDDANLGRLLDVMGTLRKDSQLIIITHQKRTMEIADALYGVSMRDDGVSAVVGQRVRDEALTNA
ncbi:chromosome segregation protein [Pontimonas salivibrio]|uniref:Chromosome partition protein Smc n=1 Tax=Pontimonas salivibrio TaxID=1159327 RepID=A0A2L2BPH7_9MICO|nr:chromosome segregation protein SMC [Pontimonas salivibrio]AVG23571.1 chromosome segregation protein [Pontimonas salivibrio]